MFLELLYTFSQTLTPLKFHEALWLQKSPCSTTRRCLYDAIFSGFNTTLACDRWNRRTDERTDPGP